MTATCSASCAAKNIYALDSKGELLITIMASLAQEESRSISENVTWGCRKRFADGKVSMPYKNFLGYRKGGNGEPEIVPEEAGLVQLILARTHTPCMFNRFPNPVNET